MSDRRSAMFCLRKDEPFWTFIWGGELLYLNNCGTHWEVMYNGEVEYFDAMSEALDWLDMTVLGD